MSSPSVITLRVSKELKGRLAELAEQQGVSMNQLLTYFLTEKVTQAEMHERIQQRFERIQGRSVEQLRQSALSVLDQQRELSPDEIPEWDRLPDEKSIGYVPNRAQSSMTVHEKDEAYEVDAED